MRLSEKEIQAIKMCTKEQFSHTAKVYLFGSRVDDTKKGGDIDLLIDCEKNLSTFQNMLQFKVSLKNTIGDQKIDVVFKNLNETDNREIITQALQTGELL